MLPYNVIGVSLTTAVEDVSIPGRVESAAPSKEAQMHKSQQPARQKAVSIQEKDLRLVMGGDDAYQHVDNPGQTPMKDGNP
jgi:hypothetical protein